jgi:hypothetical protein
MQEGDQFGIENVEHTQSYAAKGTPVFAGTDADLSAIIPSVESGDTDADFSTTELPEHIRAFLAHSAQQINEGLRGKGDRE